MQKQEQNRIWLVRRYTAVFIKYKKNDFNKFLRYKLKDVKSFI